MAEQNIYCNMDTTKREETREARCQSHRCPGHRLWNSPYTSGLLLLICILVLCVLGWLAVTRNSEHHLRLETQQNLTWMLEDANQKVRCLRTAILVADQLGGCSLGWTMMYQKCYFLSNEKKTREDSEQFCAENGAVLATVRSTDSILKSVMQYAEFWVGLEQRNSWTGDVAEVKWFWSDNTLEPSLNNKPSVHCAKMGQTVMLSPCTDLLPWICERKPKKPDIQEECP